MSEQEFFPEDYESPVDDPILERYQQEEIGYHKHFIGVHVRMPQDLLAELTSAADRLRSYGNSIRDVNGLIRSACAVFLDETGEYLSQKRTDRWVDEQNEVNPAPPKVAFLPEDYESPVDEAMQEGFFIAIKVYTGEEQKAKQIVGHTIHMSPKMRDHLISFGNELKELGDTNTGFSSLVESACEKYLSHLSDHFHEVSSDKWLQKLSARSSKK